MKAKRRQTGAGSPIEEHNHGAESLTRAEEAGLVFAFRTRAVATVVVAFAMLAVTQWPRDVYYVGFAAAFLLLGYAPFRLRRSPKAGVIKFVCTILDVLLITAAVLNIPPSGIWIDWPLQTRLRSQNFLLLLMLLGEAALTYSPRHVLWTGGWIAAIWTAAFLTLYRMPDSIRLSDMFAQRSDDEILSIYLSPTYVSLPQWGLQIIATGVLTTLLATAVYRSRRHLLAQVRAEVLRSSLARYVSPDVAQALATSSGRDFGKPATRQVAVLFADIVGFTGVSERLSPERAFDLLRSFQERSTTIVFRHRGTLDKFLGDGLMATFGAVQDEADAPARAITCALNLRAEMERWGSKRSRRGAERLSVSIGVHFGPVVVGNIGSDRRVEFTAIGDVVNVASRLEQMTRQLGCSIIISEACAAAAGIGAADQLRAREATLQVRGRADRLRALLV